MEEPVLVSEEDCLSFHDNLLARFDGASGVRDRGFLASAHARPQHLFAYEKPTMFDMAAAYAHGMRFSATEEDAVVQTLAFAAGAITAKDFTAWLERVSKPGGPE